MPRETNDPARFPTFEEFRDPTPRTTGTDTVGKAKVQTCNIEDEHQFTPAARRLERHERREVANVVGQCEQYDNATRDASVYAAQPDTLRMVEAFACDEARRANGENVPLIVLPDEVLEVKDGYRIERLSNGTIKTTLITK